MSAVDQRPKIYRGSVLLIPIIILFVVVLAIVFYGRLSQSEQSQEQGGGGSDLICITGVAVPKEDAVYGNSEKIREALRRIRQETGINIVWQLFDDRSKEEDWLEYFKIARSEGVKVLFANTEADRYVPECPDNKTCELGPVEGFLRSVAKNPEVYGGVLYAVLLVDEPYEDPVNGEQLRSLYRQAKDIVDVPLVMGWSRELWRFVGKKKGAEFSDSIADIHLISALEYRRGALDEETLKASQTTSRKIITDKDPDSLILSSVPVFGQAESRAGYDIPDVQTLEEIVDLLTGSELGRINGLMWQSWEGPTRNKARNQENLGDPGFEEHREFVKSFCQP